MVTLIQTAKMNDVDPPAWLAHVLARIAGMAKVGSAGFCRGTGERNRRRTRGLTMQVNKVQSVRTLALVAKDLGD